MRLVLLFRRLFSKCFGSLLGERQLVYKADINTLVKALDSNLSIRVVSKEQPLADHELDSLLENFDDQFRKHFHNEMAAGALLFLASDKEPVSLVWGKPSALIKKWFLPLSQQDVVYYAWYTFKRARGRGYVIRNVAFASEYFRGLGFTNVYVDVKKWNTPSRRAISKAGFSLVGEFPQL